MDNGPICTVVSLDPKCVLEKRCLGAKYRLLQGDSRGVLGTTPLGGRGRSSLGGDVEPP